VSVVVLIAAHNEQHCIKATLHALRAQHRKPERIVVAADNCTDRTVQRALKVKGVTVFETKDNHERKSGALNQAWRRFAKDADLVVCIDADTILEPTAIEEWEAEFNANPLLGGCSAKFTMLVTPGMSFSERLLVRLQRSEFSRWTDLALRRGRQTSVLAGTACCVRNAALREVMASTDRHGPWTNKSMVEDFELTYRMRELGWQTKVSATVRAYTDAMTTLRSLWAQRMNWQTGTVEDMVRFGVNKRTRFDWWLQVKGVFGILVRVVWVILVVTTALLGKLEWHPMWFFAPLVFAANDVKQAMRIPKREPADIVVAALLIPQEILSWIRAAWYLCAWGKVLGRRVLHISYGDGWAKQAKAELTRQKYRASATPLAKAA
jgi:cellulose synthase/poly-beta-1,6-N-acetylglucosamine synthase-like glycosyltransferase